MRQGNSNKRLRGRNRKGPNPLTKTFESNGPDVKIRGTALHIAEKYLQLSRDAQASGDRVMGENYLQHAEHYFRILAAAQGPNQPQQTVQRDDDYGDGQDNRVANGSGGSDPSQADQPSDSGYERQGPNGNRQRGRRGDQDKAPASEDEAMAADDRSTGKSSERASGRNSERSSGRKANGSSKPEAAEVSADAEERSEDAVPVEKIEDGAATGETAEAGDAGEAKPRRRTRTTRAPRTRTRRSSASGEGSDAPSSQDSETAASDA